MREMVGGCCVCSDDRGWSENPLVYCDGQSCTVAVHQACYGIVTVPTGPWYCRKCESQERSVKVKCELCPSKYGALKRTDNSGWAHVVCALYIPEVRFGNVTTMEPIQLQLIPAERFSKICYICEEKGKPSNAAVGACMQCNKVGCKQQFHVTCAQGLGLLCEEAGNYLDNVKYCGYCQHHYSKLKKGGNVKTIPPYKPVANEAHNSDSNSEKEPEGGPSNSKIGVSPPSSGKRKAIQGGSKAPATKNSGKNTNSQQQQKTVHNNNKASDKTKVTVKGSGKSEEAPPADNTESTKKDTESEQKEVKDTKGSKKRKANSRTPTPVSSGNSSEVSVVTTVTLTGTSTINTTSTITSDKKSTVSDSADKTKKARVETTQAIISNQPVVALTSISPTKTIVQPTTSESLPTVSTEPVVSTPPVIQTTQVISQSLVVSVPLVNTSLSPHKAIVNNQTSVVTPVSQERSSSTGSAERSTPVIINNMIGGNSNQEMLTPDMNSGGLKITYEKQPDSINTEVDMELELDTAPSANVEVPAKRGRSQSQSNDKSDRSSRNRKRNSTGTTTTPAPTPPLPNNTTVPKRSSRSRASTPPTEPPGAFSSIVPPSQIKESPPSSPSSESQSGGPIGRRTRARKSDSSVVAGGSGSSKDSKDVKVFQNGIAAPHMLGNQLNPNSTMHSKMNDHLTNELEAHSIFNPNESSSSLLGPQLHHRVLQQARASSTGSSTASGGSGLSSMLGGGGGTIPQSLDQLLERQWEQGSQFLMEQAQHFDIASLLSCLHQLRAENLRLEEHVSSLVRRRDHLLAINARLALPLNSQQPAAPLSTHPHTVNNIHPSVAAVHGEVPRSRHSGGVSSYPNHPQSTAEHPIENGLPPEAYPPNSHRSRSPGSQPSPNVRHSPAGPYPNSGLQQRQNADGRSASALRPQPYLMYDRAGGPMPISTQQQVVIRRDRGERELDIIHQAPLKPS
ncbi:protein AF-10 isoform X2 [Diabrotica virgifera virgifera]|uniref:Protein AF-10 isoform X2 n=1 Tax=Diabrotica virgifera virgifera TaxID=50390 RepID=A0A6P7FD08_DIAVI|nr:protein AF-10 isoform X2 [Diabrotica virgifera virgifera]